METQPTTIGQQYRYDGGPAHPTTPVSHGYSPDTNGHGTGCGPGMSLRDYFAAKAMVSLIHRREMTSSDTYSRPELAMEAYHYADAMLNARSQ